MSTLITILSLKYRTQEGNADEQMGWVDKKKSYHAELPRPLAL